MGGKTVGVIGAGAWGSGLAQALARGGHSVEIWALEQDVVDDIVWSTKNREYTLVGKQYGNKRGRACLD